MHENHIPAILENIGDHEHDVIETILAAVANARSVSATLSDCFSSVVDLAFLGGIFVSTVVPESCPKKILHPGAKAVNSWRVLQALRVAVN